MVHKEFCDVCGKELPVPKKQNWHNTRAVGHYFNRGKKYDTCQTCADAIERSLKELKEKYRLFEEFRKNPNAIQGQKELGDFE